MNYDFTDGYFLLNTRLTYRIWIPASDKNIANEIKAVLLSAGFSEDVISHYETLQHVIDCPKRNIPDILIACIDEHNEDVVAQLRDLNQLKDNVAILVETAQLHPAFIGLLSAMGIPVISRNASAYIEVMKYYRESSFFANWSVLGNKRLTPKEFEVLMYLLEGLSVTNIARLMHRDVRTISTHKRNAMWCVGLKSSGEVQFLGGVLQGSHAVYQKKGLSSLTSTEIKILDYLTKGWNVTLIAHTLARSVKTISAHKCNLMRKLGVQSEVALFALRQKRPIM